MGGGFDPVALPGGLKHLDRAGGHRHAEGDVPGEFVGDLAEAQREQFHLFAVRSGEFEGRPIAENPDSHRYILLVC